tara:strand:+ start:13 stop:1455 length:1443 start_codon:yes stop_codon:yes gene_type:complete
MSTVTVIAKIITDNTGSWVNVPVILTVKGDIPLITDYFLILTAQGKSRSTLISYARAFRLFLDYMEANKNIFSDPDRLLISFILRLRTGTLDEQGFDPSGLFWEPKSFLNTKNIIRCLVSFLNWLEPKCTKTYKLIPNDFRSVLLYSAWYRKNINDFLGHTKSFKKSLLSYREMNYSSTRTHLLVEGDAVAFPEEKFKTFFVDGFSIQRDLRISIRDKLILLLMHGGGLRESEAMTLWVSDIELDPLNNNSALVKIYNEEQGVAPYGWKSYKGGNSRKLFLKEKYGRIPRVSMFNTEHLGWKGGTIDHRDGYIIVNWFPSYYGEIFLSLWKVYHQYRASILCNHPYAFISFHHKYSGSPYTLNAFHQNYKNALKRINLLPSKHEGYDPHGHRHSYGRRLRRANVNPLIIRRCMHHKSLDSQTPYTEPNFNEISNTLTAASEALVKGEKLLDLSWENLTKYGFNDIDPHQYFSGENKKFKV